MQRALVVGINDYPQYPLSGCVNDALDVATYLMEERGFSGSEIRSLHDADATKAGIVQALKDMIAGSRSGDHLLFHFSGHGTQLPSSDVDEPDALDEVLCPVDFDFGDASTALTDNEIRKLVALVPAGVSLTLVVDACHSGDVAKAMKRRDMKKTRSERFMPPPDTIRHKLEGRRPRRTRAALRAVIVSACRSDEEAADTTFAGRANGAFTYYWLSRVRGCAGDSVQELVDAVTRNLDDEFDMHPEVDGPSDLKHGAFLQTSRSSGTGVSSSRAPGPVVFDQAWSANVMGIKLIAEVRISARSGGFDCQLIGNVGGGSPFVLPLWLDGNMTQSMDLMLGFRLVFTVSGWRAGQTGVSFELNIAGAPPALPFLPVGTVTVVQQRVMLPVAGLTRAMIRPATAAEFLAAIQLAQAAQAEAQPSGLRQVPERPAGASRDFNTGGNLIQLRSDFAHWGPNWREDRLIQVGFLPQGQRRSHVTLGPQQGQGNVYVSRFASDDETNGDFIMHIGNHFFGGWGSTRWVLHGWYAESNPFPKPRSTEQQEAPRPPGTNGKTSREVPELEVEHPEAGGSIRA